MKHGTEIKRKEAGFGNTNKALTLLKMIESRGKVLKSLLPEYNGIVVSNNMLCTIILVLKIDRYVGHIWQEILKDLPIVTILK
nr:hypothetical protein [Wolbachia endosymbiont of Wuchereria bancrofti]